MECNLPPPSLSSAAVMPPPPSNSRKQPSQPLQPSLQMQQTFGAPAVQRTGRPRRAEKPPPVAYPFLEDNQPTAAPRLSAAVRSSSSSYTSQSILLIARPLS